MKQQLHSTYQSEMCIHSTIGNEEWLNALVEESKGHPQNFTTKAASLGTRAHQGNEYWVNVVKKVLLMVCKNI